MKRIILTLAFVSVSALTFAQTMTDALNFGQTQYYGTARSIALGNAVTALGGDIGMIGINPAGGAVASYSQFTITPGLVFSAVSAQYSPSDYVVLGAKGYEFADQSFGPQIDNRYCRAAMPNIGLNFYMDMGVDSGLKGISVGWLMNSTNMYTGRVNSYGQNPYTSLAGAFASAATYNADGCGNPLDLTMLGNVRDPYMEPYWGSNYYSWNVLSAYDSYMISPDGRGGFVGVNQNPSLGTSPEKYRTMGALNQNSIVTKYGHRNDALFNFAFNIDDKMYVGFNLGVPTLSYTFNEYFCESADDPESFPVAIADGDQTISGNFQKDAYNYDYSVSGEGIYMKIGIIYLPTDNVRLGAALTTPTSYTMTEYWNATASTMIGGVTRYSPDHDGGEYTYTYRSPFEMNLGAAVTFLNRGLVSVDYECMNYRSMRFKDYYDDAYYSGFSDDSFYEVNTLIKKFCGLSHSLRVGAEFNLLPFLALRAGYSVVGSPEKYFEDSEGYYVDAYEYDSCFNDYDNGYMPRLMNRHKFSNNRNSLSFGVGYRSNGPFFADFTIRKTSYPMTFYSTYSAYMTDDNGLYIASPLVQYKQKITDAVITLGWRF